MADLDPNAGSEDYATANRLAMYLEMGWSDFLLPRALTSRSESSHLWPNPIVDAVRPSFYQTIAALCGTWAANLSIEVLSSCDIGAATGRLSYELASQFGKLSTIVAVEPSLGFSEWAKRLLASNAPLPLVPCLGPAGREQFSEACSRPEPLTSHPTRTVEVLTTTAEEFAAHQRVFDLVTCLNVVDRHPKPSNLMGALGKLVRPSGLLVCSSPLDFQTTWTLNEEEWPSDLHQFFNSQDWEDIGETEVFYEYRHYNRAWTRFSCQVVAKRRAA